LKPHALTAAILVERGVVNGREIRKSVCWCNDDPQASCVSVARMLFYRRREVLLPTSSKYKDGTSAWSSPHNYRIDVRRTNYRIYAVRAYKVYLIVRGWRALDFFVEESNPIEIYLNELNPPSPGFTSISMYPKLWQASGLRVTQNCGSLIELALEP